MRADRGGGEELQGEIPVRHGVQRVGGGPVEAQRRRRRVAVDREGRAGQRRRPQRALVQPPARIRQPAAVAVQHLDIGQQMVAEGDGLGGLQVGEAGHRVGGMLGRAVGQRAHQLGHLRVQPVDRVAHPEAEVGGDLVVAAAGGVQALAGLADALGEPRLDVHVDVFECGVEVEPPGLDLGADRVQAVADGGLVARPMMPARASMAAWASEPRISWRQSLRSKPIEALISAMITDGPAAKRPPHCALAASFRRWGSLFDKDCSPMAALT